MVKLVLFHIDIDGNNTTVSRREVQIYLFFTYNYDVYQFQF